MDRRNGLGCAGKVCLARCIVAVLQSFYVVTYRRTPDGKLLQILVLIVILLPVGTLADIYQINNVLNSGIFCLYS
jgi:hypothetical protein